MPLMSSADREPTLPNDSDACEPLLLAKNGRSALLASCALMCSSWTTVVTGIFRFGFAKTSAFVFC